MIELTHGANPLYFADALIQDEDEAFTEVYWLKRLDDDYAEKLAPLNECVADDCPMTLLVFGHSVLSDAETMEVRRVLAGHGIQTCFALELDEWKAQAL